MAKDIKEIIKDFVSFNMEHNYYEDEEKALLPKYLNEILFEDDENVRKFLTALLENAKTLADEHGLLPEDDESVKDDDEETEGEETEGEESEGSETEGDMGTEEEEGEPQEEAISHEDMVIESNRFLLF